MFVIVPHHMPVQVQSFLRDLLEACATLVVRRMYLFLVLSWRVTQHIRRRILISFTSIRYSCLFVLAHVSAQEGAISTF